MLQTQTPSLQDLVKRRSEINQLLSAERVKASQPGATASAQDVARVHALINERSQINDQLDKLGRTGAPEFGRVATVKVGSEARLYRPDYREAGGPSFLRDVYLSQVRNDPMASGRLARHGAEVEATDPKWQQRAIGTGAVSGLVPPEYLTNMWAELARAGRPVANLCTSLPLPPDGMTVNFSRITTGTSAAVQASEGSAVSETNADDTLLTVNVNTIAGQQTVSRQALERGVLVEEILWADLGAAYNAALDTQAINGSGSSGQHLGLLNVSGVNAITYTDGTPTVPEIWPKLADGYRQVVSQRFTGPTAFVMRPQEWGWICAGLGTDNRPLIDVATGLGQNVWQYPKQPGRRH